MERFQMIDPVQRLELVIRRRDDLAPCTVVTTRKQPASFISPPLKSRVNHFTSNSTGGKSVYSRFTLTCRGGLKLPQVALSECAKWDFRTAPD